MSNPHNCPGCSHPWGSHRQNLGTCKDKACACAPTCPRCGAGWRDRCKTPTGKRHSEHPRVAARTARAIKREVEAQAFRDNFERVRARVFTDAAAESAAWWTSFHARYPGVRRLMMSAQDLAALRVLGLGADAKPEDVAKAFREKVKRCHPDAGGDAEEFKRLVKARNKALVAVGAA